MEAEVPPASGPAADTGDDTDIGYAEAVAELEQILDELEDDTVDVDVLARRVRRAAALIRVCRSRIATARTEVEQIVVEQIVGQFDDVDPEVSPPPDGR